MFYLFPHFFFCIISFLSTICSCSFHCGVCLERKPQHAISEGLSTAPAWPEYCITVPLCSRMNWILPFPDWTSMLTVSTHHPCSGFPVLWTVGIPFFAPTQVLHHAGWAAVHDSPHTLISWNSLGYLVFYFVVKFKVFEFDTLLAWSVVMGVIWRN